MNILRNLWNTFLDRTIYFSFDSSGFKRHQKQFKTEDYSKSEGKTALITGGNSGIGFATALAFAKNGLKVHLLCRNKERGEAAKKKIVEASGNPHITLHVVDLSDLHDVRAFAKHPSLPKFSILVNNAGSMPLELQVTPQGYELTFASQVFGHFILTHLLIKNGNLKNQSRVILVSSGGMYTQKLDLSDLSFKKTEYNQYTAYANAKRAQVILNEEFAEKYKDKEILFSCMHPGWVDTSGVQKSMPSFYRFTKKRLRTSEQGADTIIWLALTETRYPSGKFWFDREIAKTHLLNRTKETQKDREQLWKLCMEAEKG